MPFFLSLISSSASAALTYSLNVTSSVFLNLHICRRHHQHRSMFDLNIINSDVDISHPAPSSQTLTHTQSAATSTSSIIVNATSACDDQDSASINFTTTTNNNNIRPLQSTTLISFDILNIDHHQYRKTPLVPDGTRNLFPNSPTTESGSVFVPIRQWLNLSSAVVDSESFNRSSSLELCSLQQQQKNDQIKPVAKKSRRGPRSRSSPYRGVTFYRRTGRWESHIWDCGKQVYLGGFDTAHTAARAYDRAAIKFRGVEADINFDLHDYDQDMKRMSELSKEEFIHVLRRQSTGFTRNCLKYRGVILQKYGKNESIPGQLALAKMYNEGVVANINSIDRTLDLSLNVSGSSEYTKFGRQKCMFESSTSSPVLYGQPPNRFAKFSLPVWQFAHPSSSGHFSFNKAQTPAMERRPGFSDWSMQVVPNAASLGFSSGNVRPIAPSTHATASSRAEQPTNALFCNYKN